VTNVPASGGSPTHAQVLDQVGLAVIATDVTGTVTTWNERAETLYGWTREEAIGKPILDLKVPADASTLAEEVMAAIRAGQSWQGAIPVRRKDGSVFTTYMKDSPVLDGDGNVIGIVGVSIDLSDGDLAAAMRAIPHAAAPAGTGNHQGRRSRLLSPREREILGHLARGLTGEQIAERLVLSPETIRTHIRNAREKLGASTRVEAVTRALLSREIQP
jgi:PAS domain S-box-containing protein